MPPASQLRHKNASQNGEDCYNAGMGDPDPSAGHVERPCTPAGGGHFKLDQHERDALRRRADAISKQLDHLHYDHLPVVPHTHERSELAKELAELLQILCEDETPPGE